MKPFKSGRILILIFSCNSTIGYSEPGIITASAIEIKIDDHLLSLKAQSIPLQDLLTVIAEITGIKINIIGTLNKTININVRHIKPVTLITRLADNYNHFIIYSRATPNYSAASIKQINIYGNSKPANKQLSNIDQQYSEINFDLPDEGINHKLELITALDLEPDKIAIPALIEQLNEQQNQAVKHAIIETLGNRQGKIVVDALATALNDTNPAIRATITDVLLHQRDKLAPLILAQILYGDSDPGIRAIAAEALRSSHFEHAEFFLQAAENDAKYLESEVSPQN